MTWGTKRSCRKKIGNARQLTLTCEGVVGFTRFSTEQFLNDTVVDTLIKPLGCCYRSFKGHQKSEQFLSCKINRPILVKCTFGLVEVCCNHVCKLSCANGWSTGPVAVYLYDSVVRIRTFKYWKMEMNALITKYGCGDRSKRRTSSQKKESCN